MKFILIAAVMLWTSAWAKSWGLGAVLGDPTGLSANYFFNETRTLHSVLAYDIDGDDDLFLAGHYTFRRPNDIRLDQLKLGWFYGAGAQLEYHDHDHNHRGHDHDDDLDIGPSGTLGAYHEFANIPLELFVKSNLTLYVLDDTDLDLDVMLGLHYNI